MQFAETMSTLYTEPKPSHQVREGQKKGPSPDIPLLPKCSLLGGKQGPSFQGDTTYYWRDNGWLHGPAQAQTTSSSKGNLLWGELIRPKSMGEVKKVAWKG